MFRFHCKIKRSKVQILKWKQKANTDLVKQIQNIKQQMESMQEQGGTRGWNQWRNLKIVLNKAYGEEETY